MVFYEVVITDSRPGTSKSISFINNSTTYTSPVIVSPPYEADTFLFFVYGGGIGNLVSFDSITAQYTPLWSPPIDTFPNSQVFFPTR